MFAGLRAGTVRLSTGGGVRSVRGAIGFVVCSSAASWPTSRSASTPTTRAASCGAAITAYSAVNTTLCSGSAAAAAGASTPTCSTSPASYWGVIGQEIRVTPIRSASVTRPTSTSLADCSSASTRSAVTPTSTRATTSPSAKSSGFGRRIQ